jgi:hypothetical protein
MTYWNINTNAPWSETAVAHILNPSYADRHAAGRRIIAPFVVPDGMATIPGTRRIEIDGDTVREIYDVQTQDEADAAAYQEQLKRR